MSGLLPPGDPVAMATRSPAKWLPSGGLGPGLPRRPAAGDCPLPAIYCPLSRRLVPLSTQIPGLQLAVPWLCTRLLLFTLTKMAAKCSCAMPARYTRCLHGAEEYQDVKNEDQGCFTECWSRCVLPKSQSMVCIPEHLLKKSSK